MHTRHLSRLRQGLRISWDHTQLYIKVSLLGGHTHVTPFSGNMTTMTKTKHCLSFPNKWVLHTRSRNIPVSVDKWECWSYTYRDNWRGTDEGEADVISGIHPWAEEGKRCSDFCIPAEAWLARLFLFSGQRWSVKSNVALAVSHTTSTHSALHYISLMFFSCPSSQYLETDALFVLLHLLQLNNPIISLWRHSYRFSFVLCKHLIFP